MKTPRCFECSEYLVTDEDWVENDGVRHRTFLCPRCGMRYAVDSVSEEEKRDYPYYNM